MSLKIVVVKIFILVFMLCLSMDGRSQRDWIADVSGFSGRFLSHKPYRSAPESIQWGGSIALLQETDGRHYWEYAHDYPQKGLLLGWRNLGNEKVYGSAFYLIPFLEFNVINTSIGDLQIRHGTGISYITKHFHRENNPQNLMVGSTVNASSFIDLGFRFNMSDNSWMKAGAAVQHFSNGSVVVPNAGVNIGSVYLAGLWRIQPTPATHYHKISYAPYEGFKRWRWRIGTAVGISRTNDSRWVSKSNWQMNFVSFYQHNSRFRTGLGIEVGHILSKNHDLQTAVYLEEEVQFYNIVTRYAIGGYLTNRIPGQESHFTKIGMAYFPTFTGLIPEGLYFGSFLKAHGFKAAHIELNIGYVF